MTTIQAGHIQDAYHYALAAAGDGNSTFEAADRRRNERWQYDARSKGEYLRMAVKAAREGGLRLYVSELSLRRYSLKTCLPEARHVSEAIRREAVAAGVCPFTGSTTAECRARLDGRCWFCRAPRDTVPCPPPAFEPPHVATERARYDLAMQGMSDADYE